MRSKTPPLCVSLGLDPAHYAIVPIPFDAYLRLAPRFGWGGERMWTHFDGYQASHGFHLRALVGGDAGYGGAADLCSVGRDYESERIGSRFCVVRRHAARRVTCGALRVNSVSAHAQVPRAWLGRAPLRAVFEGYA